MKKGTKILCCGIGAAVLLVIAILLVINYSAAEKSVFNGDRVRNPDRYYLSFTYMNQDDSAVMTLHAGEELHAYWEIEKGRVDIAIAKENGELIYQGNEIDRADFLLPITESGEYTVTISAGKAKGIIDLTVE